MTLDQLYTFVTSLLNGVEIDPTLFNTFLDVAQSTIEGMRPWSFMRAEDASQTASGSTSFTTPLALPSGFRNWYGRHPVVLVDGSNNALFYLEIPISYRYQYKDSANRFFCDYGQNLLYLCGTLNGSYAVHLYFVKDTTLISTSATQTWSAPTKYHKVIGFFVAALYKQGIDYDLISNLQADAQVKQGTALIEEMVRWDDRLQSSSIQGIGNSDMQATYGRTADGGNVPLFP